MKFNSVLVTSICALFVSSLAFASTVSGLTPSEMKIKVYKFSVSKSEDCTNLITLFEDSSGKEVDMLAGPEIGKSKLDDGTYPCVAYEMADIIKFKPNATSGYCTAGTEYSLDVCRGDHATLHDGTVVICNATRGVEDKVAVYVSTVVKTPTDAEAQTLYSSSPDDLNSFMVPSTAKPYRGIKLDAALVVAGKATGVMVIDATNKVGSDSDEQKCGMEPPVFSFKTE